MKTNKKRRFIGLKLFLLVVVLLSVMVYDSNTRIVADEYPLYYNNLPAAFDGYRIAQLSDVHAAVFGADNTKLISTLRKTRPNIIVITGDLISYSDTSDDISQIVKPLIKAVTGIAPVYYVTGNHEWDSDSLNELLDMLSQNGVTILHNEYVKLTVGDSSIVLAGVDDPNGPRDMKTPETLVSEIRENESDTFLVMLTHRNKFLHRYAQMGTDLVLCGHAHGGIIRLPFLGGLIGPSREWFPDYTEGVYTDGLTKIIVSRGIGNKTGVPRFLNNPQIPVVILRSS